MDLKRILRKQLAVFLSLAIIVVMVLPSIFAQKENVVRLAMDCVPSTFNPLLATRDVCQSVWFSYLLWEPLALRLVNGSLVPWLARSWEILDNGTRYVFHLDNRARWGDGTPVTARDVEVTWNQTITYVGLGALYGILKEVKAVDDNTVEFITTQPYINWFQAFAQSLVRPAHIWSDIPDPMSYELINDPSLHVSSSPFKYDSFKAGEWYLFKTRQDYWKTESKPKIDGILVRYISDMSMYPLLLLRDEVDIAIPYPINLIASIVGQPNIGIRIGPISLNWVAINTRLYPLSLPEVRRAIDIAIDKVDISQNYWMGYGVPANRSLIDLAHYPEFYVPEAAWPGLGKTHQENLAEANRILDELGFAKGPDGIRVTPNGTRLSYRYVMSVAPLTTIRIRTAQRIIENLKEIGIEINQFQALPATEAFATIYVKEPKTWGFGEAVYGAFAVVWEPQVVQFISPAVGNVLIKATGWNSSEYNEVAHKALKQIEYDKLVEYVKELIKIFARELPVISVVFGPVRNYVYRTDKFTNWNFDASTLTSAFGWPCITRPLMYCELEPIGWVPPPTPTPTPMPSPTPAATPTPTPTPVVTPTPTPVVTPTPTPVVTPTPTPVVTPTPTPTAAPAGLTAEQIIVIAIAVIVIIAIMCYVVIRTKRKPEK